MPPPRVKALVFDVSGVLRDSKKLMKVSYERAFKSCGVEVDVNIDMIYKLRGLQSFNDLRNSIRLLVGTKGDVGESVVAMKHANAILVDEMNGRRVEDDVVEKVRTAFREEFSSEANRELITLLPGVETGLEKLRERYTLGVLSNSTLRSLERDLGHIAHHFTFMVPDACKPETSIYLSTLKTHGLSPGETAYIGDAVSDVQLASSAGSLPLAMLTGMGTRAHLEAAGPHVVCESFDHLVSHLID
eukprot:TRINITY_DN382_c1_g1_i1.p1 TRINITY_DN382_c1_g1~~TRINITY_DN382_c1_g1_i1.p1  ORF type:complete len:261 (+),score=65.96 TRINITY_DN382_c1_g1_i1:51-785(+)